MAVIVSPTEEKKLCIHSLYLILHVQDHVNFVHQFYIRTITNPKVNEIRRKLIGNPHEYIELHIATYSKISHYFAIGKLKSIHSSNVIR